MNTPEGRKKGVSTMRQLHGEDIYAKIGALGGKNSPNRPMTDANYASRLANIRWTKYKYQHGEIDEDEYIKRLEALGVSTTTV